LAGAEAFASTNWVVAHLLAVAGFTLLALGVLGLYLLLQAAAVDRVTYWALVVTWIGVALTLPYYGAEVFGLRAIGQEAIKQQSTAVMALADSVRYGPGIVVFGAGLALLAVGAVAVAVWRSGSLSRWSGIPLAVGFALYIPQFFGSQPIRVAHGVLVAVGCVWIAVGMATRTAESK
jgi:hypothetical protein